MTRVCPVCQHPTIDHCGECAWPGCQVDIMTGDGPEPCGCDENYDDE